MAVPAYAHRMTRSRTLQEQALATALYMYSGAATTDITSGTGLQVRSSGGSALVSIGQQGQIEFPPSQVFEIAKSPGTLNFSFDLYSVLPQLNLHSLVEANPARDPIGFQGPLTDSDIIGKHITVTEDGVSYSVLVTKFSGQLGMETRLLPRPLLDAFYSTWRGSAFDGGFVINIHGTTEYRGYPANADLSINMALGGLGGVNSPRFIKSVYLGAPTMGPSALRYGLVTLTSYAASSGEPIQISGAGPVSILTPNVLVLPGKNSAQFAYRTNYISYPQTATITAVDGIRAESATVAVLPLLARISAPTTGLLAGMRNTLYVQLSAPAPKGGVTVQLSCSSVDSYISQNSPTCFVPAGATFAPFYVQTALKDTTLTVSGTLGGTTTTSTFALK